MKYRSRALRLGQQAFVTNLLSRYATRHFFNIVRGITWDFIQSHRILHVKIVLEWSEDYSTILTLYHSVPWINCAQQYASTCTVPQWWKTQMYKFSCFLLYAVMCVRYLVSSKTLWMQSEEGYFVLYNSSLDGNGKNFHFSSQQWILVWVSVSLSEFLVLVWLMVKSTRKHQRSPRYWQPTTSRLCRAESIST